MQYWQYLSQFCLSPFPELSWSSMKYHFFPHLTFLNFTSPQKSKTSNTCCNGFQLRQKKNHSRICQYYSQETRGSFKRISTTTWCQGEAFYGWASAHPPELRQRSVCPSKFCHQPAFAKQVGRLLTPTYQTLCLHKASHVRSQCCFGNTLQSVFRLCYSVTSH